MKEAAGEANLTVITIIILGVVAAIMTPIITNVLNSSKAKSECIAKGYIWDESRSGNDKCISPMG